MSSSRKQVPLLSCRRAAGALVAAGALALALPAAASAAPALSHSLTVHIVNNTATVSSSSTRPGWTHISNAASTPVLVLRGTGQDAATLAADYNHGRYARVSRLYPVATTVDPQADAYARLRRGSYFVLDGEHDGTWTAAQIATVTVAGSALDAALPRANRIVVDKHLDVHAPATVSRLRYAKLVDAASGTAAVEAFTIDPGTSQAAVQRFVAHPSRKKLRTLGASTVTIAQECSPKATIYNPEYLRKGREMLISFRSLTAKLHPGQARLITVR